MTQKRNIYLEMTPLVQARALFLDKFSSYRVLESESVPVSDAVGRILAEPVFARTSSPGYHAAAMDGVAVRAKDTFGAVEGRPKSLTIGKSAFYVNTGHMLPDGCDAVIMIEYVITRDDGRIEIEAPAFPWQHVRKMGEDIVATQLLFPQNHLITPYCVGAFYSGGVFHVPVRKRPLVVIIPTGKELVDPKQTPEDLAPGRVYECNSYMLGKIAESAGARFERRDTLNDDLALIKSTVKEAIEGDADMVLIIGGSSAGSEDCAKQALTDLGEIWVHGVTMMPGKPVILGKIQNKPAVGIPGYPVSAAIAFEQFVSPLIHSMLGQSEPGRPTVEVVPTRKIASRLGLEEFVRVKLGKVGSRIVASPLPRGAGTITSLTQADGIIRIPSHSEGLVQNVPVNAELLRPLSTVENTIVAVGSHDNALDVLADELKARHGNLTLSSSHVGSLGGLMAIKNRGCHLAGAHLLDTSDGSYNISYVKKYLPETKIRLVTLLFRDQGLIVAKGNPKTINSIEDLGREDIRFVNRQAGSGTRILLDYKLSAAGMDPAHIAGYENEEYTHMSVAVAVLGRVADVGLGIHAAARALDLDFIPVVTERYDLVIPEEHMDMLPIRELLETIQSKEFKVRVEALGGYHMEETGNMIVIHPNPPDTP
jgi:putative molybdopterin biosynthesis protein